MPKMDIITRMEETEKLLAAYPNLDSTTINELPLYAFQMLINGAKGEKLHWVTQWGYTVNRNGKRVSYSF